MKIDNAKYTELARNDLLICVLGFEPRSYFLLKKNFDTRDASNTLVFRLCSDEHICDLTKEMEGRGIAIIDCNYNETTKVIASVCDFIKSSYEINIRSNVYIDYSSMPRSWYCALPLETWKYSCSDRRIVFLYTAGDYPYKYKDYPTAGIDSIVVFSGNTLPAVDVKRYHIMGLGFDKIRTETVKSIIEPDLLVTCYAYNPDSNIRADVLNKNKNLIEGSVLSLALPIDNFRGMIDRLSELIYDLTRDSQVIIIPDGAKPLIMAMSLVSEVVKKEGVTCLHISRNCYLQYEIRVTPREDEIYGFQVYDGDIVPGTKHCGLL